MLNVQMAHAFKMPHYKQSLDHHFLKTVNDRLQTGGLLSDLFLVPLHVDSENFFC